MEPSTEFLRTVISSQELILVLTILVLTIASLVAYQIFYQKEETDPKTKTYRMVTFILSSVFLAALMVVGLLFIFSNSYETMENNVKTNVKQVYDIDAMTITKRNEINAEEPMEAMVFKGDNFYNVIITQNPDTYEPTLLSSDNNTVMEHLKHK